MSLDLGLSALVVAGVLHTLRTHLRLERVARPSGGDSDVGRYPSVTVVRPIKGLDPGLRENLEAAFHHDYPNEVETLFVLDDAREPALALVRAAMAKRRASRGRARLIFCGAPPAGRTGKLNAMIAGLQRASGELVVFADSDTRPGPRALRILVETLLRRSDAGAAFAPVVASARPRTLGDAGYAVMLNGLYGPEAAAAGHRRGGTLPFIMGQFMAMRREAIDAIGGLESAEGQLVDDMYLGRKIHEAGYTNVIAPHLVPVIHGGLSLRQFVHLYRRWIGFGRSGLPAREFKLGPWVRASIFWLGLVAAALGVAMGSAWTAAAGILAPLGVAASMNRLHRVLGGAPLRGLQRAAGFLLLLVAPAVLLSLFLKREVRWRGRTYALDAASRLSRHEELAQAGRFDHLDGLVRPSASVGRSG